MSETVTDAGVAGGEQQSAPVADASSAPETSIRETMEAVFDAAQDRDDENPGLGHNGGPEIDREAPQRALDGKYAPRQTAAAEKIAPPEGWRRSRPIRCPGLRNATAWPFTTPGTPHRHCNSNSRRIGWTRRLRRYEMSWPRSSRT